MARILFVDDDFQTLETLNKSVQIIGHQAFLASTGEEALALAGAEDLDLIMTDMMLPDMDGLTLVKKLRQSAETAPIPVVMLSASPEVDLAEVSKAAGANTFLNKPVRLQTLFDTIHQFTTSS
jgi:CheY-like chemotaxis protein